MWDHGQPILKSLLYVQKQHPPPTYADFKVTHVTQADNKLAHLKVINNRSLQHTFLR